MNKKDLLIKYANVVPVNYEVDFVKEQLDILQELKRTECIAAYDEKMSLTIICSALRYYLEASPEGYGEEIINITERLEAIYNIDDLLEDLLEVTT